MADGLSTPTPDPQAGLRQFIMRRPVSEVLMLRKRVSLLEAQDHLRRIGREPSLPLEFTSQYGEDCWLWELFQGQKDGFYIEVGAFDGYTYSVSYPFEVMG